MKRNGSLQKGTAILLTLVMSVAMLAGCGGQKTTSSDKTVTGESDTVQTDTSSTENQLPQVTNNGNVSDASITVALPAEPNSLVPAIIQCGTETNSVIMSLLYETLYKNNYETLEHTDSSLVENTEQIDETHFRLTLKKGIKFQNGEELTTEDVMYTFQQGAAGALKGEYSIYNVENFKVEDDYNIIFETVQPWAQAQDRLGFEMFFIANKEVFEAAGGADSTVQHLENAGTGKYTLTEWVAGDHITVTRNENYWDKQALPYYKEIKFVFINDSSARGMAVQSGDVDIAIGLDLANYSVYEADANIKAVVLNDNRTAVLFLNSGNGGPLEDEKVREAVYWCLDKEALRQVGMSGFGELQDTIISTKAPVWDGVVPEVYTPDYEKAKTLLAEAGYPDGVNLKFRVYSITATITMLQEQLRLGGINVDLELAEIPVHFAALAEGDFDMCYSLQQFAYYTEPVRCCDGINYKYSDVMGGTGYKNEEFSEIASRCYAAVDMTERKAAYAELLAHFREHYVSCGLFSSSYLCLAAKDIEGLALRGMAVVDLTNIYSTENK